jgi:hypothetical protein
MGRSRTRPLPAVIRWHRLDARSADIVPDAACEDENTPGSTTVWFGLDPGALMYVATGGKRG